MSEPAYDYYATRIVQDLEDDLYGSKERIQRLRRQNAELTSENDRLSKALEAFDDWLTESTDSAYSAIAKNAYANAYRALTELLEGVA